MSEENQETTQQEHSKEGGQDKRKRRYLLLLFVLLILLLCVISLWMYYLRTRKPITTALPPAPVVAQVIKPQYVFSIYGVQRPIGVAVDPSGTRIFVTESAGERLIKVFNRDGDFLFSFAPPDTRPGDRAPVYVAVDTNGRVLVTDRRLFSVLVFDLLGNFIRKVEKPPTGEEFWAPLGIHTNGDEILITDVTKGEHRVLVLDQDFNLKLSFGSEGQEEGQFWFPNAVVRDVEGRFYVSDGNNGRIQVFSPEGEFLYLQGGFNLPRGMAIDEEQRLFLADAVGHVIRVFTVAEQPFRSLYELGDLGVGNGEFKYPNDIAVDNTGRLYIVDRENNRVQVWAY